MTITVKRIALLCDHCDEEVYVSEGDSLKTPLDDAQTQQVLVDHYPLCRALA